MKAVFVSSLLVLFSAQPAIAQASQASLQAELATAQRIKVISSSDVWTQPDWMSSDFSFSPTFDIKNFVQEKSTQGLLGQNEVHCLMTQEYATQNRGNGLSPKFNCDLMKVNASTGQLEVVRNKKNKPIKLKVKYSSKIFGMAGVRQDANSEVQAEVMATRFMSALGFSADKMFLVKTLKCHGCSNDPWNIRRLEKGTRVFPRVSVEFKASGDEIKVSGTEGWSYAEVMDENSFARDRAQAREQLLERQALFILAGMLQHSDNKPDNHRINCEGKIDERGTCIGKIRLMIHDLGFTFGGGTKVAQLPRCFPYCSSKAILKDWKQVALWWDESNRNACTINMGFSAAWKQPVVTEEARLFVARLLRRFVEGAAGQKRLIDMFNLAGVEEAGAGKATEWAKAFILKVEEIENPALSDNNRQPGDPYAQYTRDDREDRARDPAITCPNRLDNVLEKIIRKQR